MSRHHARPCPDPDAPADGPALLDLLGHLDPGVLVIVGADRAAHGPTLRTRLLPSDHRCGGAALFGISAPRGATAAGASLLGRPVPAGSDDQDHVALSGSTPPAPGDGPDQRVDVLVTARGDVLSQVHGADGAVIPTGGPATGVVVDALHRVLGLPAPGAPPPLTDLVGVMWLHELIASHPSAPPDWADAVALHPALPSVGHLAPSAEALAQSMQDLAAETDWDALRRAAACGRMAAPELTPDEAAWMDDTFFARWVLESFPAVSTGLAHLRRAGATDVADRVADVLRRLDPAGTGGGCDPCDRGRGKLT